MHGCLQGKIQSNESLHELKLIIVVRGDLQNNEIIGDPWYQTASMRTLKYFLADYGNHNLRLYQLYFHGSFIEANVKHRVFVKLGGRYEE